LKNPARKSRSLELPSALGQVSVWLSDMARAPFSMALEGTGTPDAGGQRRSHVQAFRPCWWSERCPFATCGTEDPHESVISDTTRGSSTCSTLSHRSLRFRRGRSVATSGDSGTMTDLRDTAPRLAFATSVDREITKVPDGTGCSYVAPNSERRYLIAPTLTARYKMHSRSQPVRGFSCEDAPGAGPACAPRAR